MRLARHLDRRRFDPQIWTCIDGIGPRSRAALGPAGVRVASLGMRGFGDLRGLARLVRLMRRESVDLIHARLQRAGFYARLAAPLAGRPIVLVNVVNMYGHHFESQHGRLKAAPLLAAERATRGLVDRWVANSAAAAADLVSAIGIERQSIAVVPNAVDAEPFVAAAARRAAARAALGLDADTVVVGSVNRLVPLKRVSLLIDAVARIQGANIHLLLVGDGPERHALEAQSRALSVPVTFTGHRHDVPELLSAMDIFAFASSSEGQPNAVLEAMAAGLPVVAASLPAFEGVIADGVHGVVVEASAEQMADALRSLAVDPAARARLGAAAKREVESRFSTRAMVEAYEHIYADALGARHTA